MAESIFPIFGWSFPLVIADKGELVIALALVGITVLIATIRKIRFCRLGALILTVGLLLFALAAGEPSWRWPTRGVVTVMIDLSASTRGAIYRDRGALLERVHQLLGETPYQLLAFSDHNQPLPTPADLLERSLADLPSERTIYAPPPADAVLLFSDGQFELPPNAPPTYPVIDPALDRPADAAVTDLISFNTDMLASVRNIGPARSLQWTGAVSGSNQPIEGDFTARAIPAGDSRVTASLSPGDLWPENDQLSFLPAPPELRQRWWIGENAPSGWRAVRPTDLPSTPMDYLQPAVVVLNNISADALSSGQQQLLVQYVRDLGGSLLIVGGDRAFAAGHYEGTMLDDLSPLASSPPEAQMQWILLMDSSGSMAGSGEIPSPWQTEVNAITRLIPQLPPNDPASIGSFAESLQWWSTGRSVVETQHLQLPPADAHPTGPTNLSAALKAVASAADGSIPAQLLLMTDADAELPDPAGLMSELTAKKIHLHLLATGRGGALPFLREIASQTGGSVIEQFDAGQWVASAKLLLRSAMPDRYEHRAVEVGPPPRVVPNWNQTWMKRSAMPIEKSDETTLSAKWQLGLGQVQAMAYPADSIAAAAFASQIAVAPEDPRFRVNWSDTADLKITVNAVDDRDFINNQAFALQMLDPQTGGSAEALLKIPQTAPGEYQIDLPAPRSASWLTVFNAGRILKRFAVAGRYPREFDAIGNNIANLQALADRTGGKVILPGPVKPINFRWPVRETPIGSELAMAGLAMIGFALFWNRRREG